MKAKPLNLELLKYLRKHGLEKRFNRQLSILQDNFRHPSLHTEILEPRSRKVYSFRIDIRYRVIFVVRKGEIEIIDINDHYQ